MLYVSLGTKTDAHKLVRDTPKELEKDHKATRRKKECNRINTAPPRRPRAHGPRRPRAHGLLREFALEHPVRTGLYRAHGTPVRTGPTYPVRTGPTGWTAVSCCLGLLFIHFVPIPIYSVPRPFVRGSKVVDTHL